MSRPSTPLDIGKIKTWMPATSAGMTSHEPGPLVSVQAPRGVVMIRSHHFRPNAATAEDNVFQATDAGLEAANHR